MSRTIAICIATYRRPVLLHRLLLAIGSTSLPPDSTVEVRVIDNDAEGGGAGMVEAMAPGLAPLVVRSAIEPRQNIAHARNRALEFGPADTFVFIDDDEVPGTDWLLRIIDSLDRNGVDAVVGAVTGRCPPEAPTWMRRGRFFDKPTVGAGQPFPWRGGRTSNTAIVGSWLGRDGLRFDPAYGLSGGEDTDLFLRMSVQGARFAGAPGAAVWETVETDRLSFRWLWRRHVRGGRNYHRMARRDPAAFSPPVQLARRLSSASLKTIAGLPALAAGRPEAFIRGVLIYGVAWGGLSAWLRPVAAERKVSYAARSSSRPLPPPPPPPETSAAIAAVTTILADIPPDTGTTSVRSATAPRTDSETAACASRS